VATGGILASCSWSVTALKALVAARPALVRLGVGHPINEGIKAASWLAARGIEVEIMPDAALAGAARGARGVVVGADQVLADGSVVNRCATLVLAHAAWCHRVPFIVACQRIKLGGAERAEIESLEGAFGDLPGGVRGLAPIFDVTPAAFVGAVITESGVMTPAEAGEVGLGIAALRRRILGPAVTAGA